MVRALSRISPYLIGLTVGCLCRFKRTGKHNEIFLATKFGFKFGGVGESSVDGSPAYVREAFDRSIKKLGTDYVDLYYLHVSLFPRADIAIF